MLSDPAGDNGVLALIDALKLNPHFSRLNLSNNGIRNKGAIALGMLLNTFFIC